MHGHGGDVHGLARELGRSPGEILDFSGNISPLGPPEGLREALFACYPEVRFLPEVDSRSLREALAARYGGDPEGYLVGAGTTEWIHLLPAALRADPVVVPLPTYADYADAARQAGRPLRMIGPWPGPGEEEALAAALSAAAEEGDRPLCFVCNPNNPTGRFLDPDALRALAEGHPRAAWVVDESYAPFVGPDAATSLLARELPGNLLVLRSFSKIYGVPGLRIGFAAGAPALLAPLRAAARPWSVDRLAQVAGVFLLGATGYEERVRGYWPPERDRLLAAIAEAAPFLRPRPGAAHFTLCEVRPPWTARELTGALRRRGILVRDCGNFEGLRGEWVRISLRTPRENAALVRCLREIAGERSG
nr:aminotransferase class I/II-fold pyridoxal phosphate-dependent enzyme [Dissulfurirhabdus thermomarina]